MASTRKKRSLSTEEQALWESVRRTVIPLRNSSVSLSRETAGIGQALEKAIANAPATPQTHSPGRVAPIQVPVKPFLPPYQAQPQPAPSHPVSRIDDTTARKLRKGRMEIDARIDLHGMSEFEAHERLYRFLLQESMSNSRLVLVITGKGARSGGILRNAVPRWLGEQAFRSLVGGCRQAHLAHGGEGALYVRLRRPKPGGLQ
ncbi:MAG: Smr/MutS family protein [Nitratireductor sp.]